MNYVKAIFTALKATSAKIDWEYFKKVEDWNENVGGALTPVSDISRLTEVSGDGLTTASLHDKSGNATWVNYGLTAVDGFRGKAISANGSSYAVADSPIIGTVGTISIKFNLPALVGAQTLFANMYTTATDGYTGVYLSIQNGTILVGIDGIATNVGTYVAGTDCTISIASNGKVYKNGSLIAALSAFANAGIRGMLLGAGSLTSERITGTIHDFRIDSRILTDAEVLSWHNDPRSVDSTPISATPSSGAIITWPATPSGTITPVLAFGGNSVGITYTTQTGRYINSCGILHFWLRLIISSKGTSTGNMTISGLPAKSSSSDISVFNMLSNGLSFGGYVVAYTGVGATGAIAFESENADGTYSAITDANVSNNMILYISGEYEM